MDRQKCFVNKLLYISNMTFVKRFQLPRLSYWFLGRVQTNIKICYENFGLPDCKACLLYTSFGNSQQFKSLYSRNKKQTRGACNLNNYVFLTLLYYVSHSVWLDSFCLYHTVININKNIFIYAFI